MTTYTMYAIRGEAPDARGDELNLSALEGADFAQDVWAWMIEHAPEGDTDAWILVTPADEHAGFNINPIAHCEVELVDGTVAMSTR